MTEQVPKKQKWNKPLVITAGVMLTVAVFYIVMAVFFKSHFTFGTTINGLNVGGKNTAQVEKLLKKETETYVLEILEREDKVEGIAGSNIGLELKLNGEVKALLKEQNGLLWIGDIFKKPALVLEQNATYDERALRSEVSSLNALKPSNQREPVNATYSEYTGTGYELVPADYGTTLIEEKVVKAVEEAVGKLAASVDLAEHDCYVKPEIEDDNKQLTELLMTLNTYTATEIHYQFGEKEEVLAGDRISEWLSVDEDMMVNVDSDGVLAYVKELAKKYNTAFSPKKLMTSYGTEVTITNGSYGWWIDNAGEKDQIIADLETGEKIEREPVYFARANSYGENDYGDSYVEINLTAQHLFLYVEGELIVESDFVSGCIKKGFGTPGGAFPITYTTKDAVLRGADYATPVNYWMPFNGNIGMHDLTSRKAFGGDIYVTNGSHGCINLPYNAAKTIYENVEKGFPVLVYKLPGSESETVRARAVPRVVDAINAIGPVTELSGPPIQAARYMYDALDSTQKAQVSNYNVLVEAESIFAAIEAQMQAATQELTQ